MKRHPLLLLSCSLLLLLPIWGCQRATSVVETTELSTHVMEVDVVPVARQPIDSSIDLTGTLYPWKFATIASEVTGVIESVRESGERIQYEIDGKAFSKELPLDIGHTVKLGDVLIKIASSESEQAVRVAEAKKVSVEKELLNLFAWKRSEEVDQLKAQCDECDAILLDAKADLNRAETLVQRKATSQKEVEDAQRAVAIAKAAKQRADSALELAEAGPTVEQIEVAKALVEMAKADVALQQETVDKCTIRCPLETATVVERYVGVGDHVTANPSTPLIRVVDSSILLAQIHVPERYQGLINIRDKALLTAEGGRAAELHMGEIEAMVVLVNAQIDPDTRTFRVRVGIDNSRNLLKAGTFVKVQIPLNAVSDAVVVPADAITFSKGEPAAFVVKNGVVDCIPVKLGIWNRTHYQIVSGLTENDVVVKGDLSLMAPGLRVQPRTVVAEATAEPTTSATRAQG